MSQLLGFAEGITALACAFFLFMAINDLLKISPKIMAIVLVAVNGIAFILGVAIQLYVCLKHWW